MKTQILKLAQIIKEMQDPQSYYSKPDNVGGLVYLPDRKMQEWISRLNMIKEGLQDG